VVRVPDAAWENMHLHLLLVHSAESESETNVLGRFYLSAVRRHCTERIQPPGICTRQVKLSVRRSPPTRSHNLHLPKNCFMSVVAVCTPYTINPFRLLPYCPLVPYRYCTSSPNWRSLRPANPQPGYRFLPPTSLLSAHMLNKDRRCISSFQKGVDRSAS
jgi:hypothetical protein